MENTHSIRAVDWSISILTLDPMPVAHFLYKIDEMYDFSEEKSKILMKAIGDTLIDLDFAIYWRSELTVDSSGNYDKESKEKSKEAFHQFLNRPEKKDDWIYDFEGMFEALPLSIATDKLLIPSNLPVIKHQETVNTAVTNEVNQLVSYRNKLNHLF